MCVYVYICVCLYSTWSSRNISQHLTVPLAIYMSEQWVIFYALLFFGPLLREPSRKVYFGLCATLSMFILPWVLNNYTVESPSDCTHSVYN